MTIIKTAGRTDLEDLFEQSDILRSSRLKHTPFLVFSELIDGDVRVEIVESAKQLVAEYAPDTPVMVQWRGQWSSDFFQMTVADVIAAISFRNSKRGR